jgi:lipopolysaccharide heptosyltransferase II
MIRHPLVGGGVPKRILVVKLADLGDLLTATPALRALRVRFPTAQIDALVTPSSAPLLNGLDSVHERLLFEKSDFDRPRDALSALPAAVALGARLRARRYDTLVLLHHLTTAYGTAKYAALALASGASLRVGLDNGRGRFLTHRAEDLGFGQLHEVDYWLSVAATLGARHPDPRLEICIPSEADVAAEQRWAELGVGGAPTAILHPGSGAFSLARRWPAERYAGLADRLATELGVRVVVLAGPAPGEVELARRVAAEMSQTSRVLQDVPNAHVLAALLRRCSLFVGNDSGVMHLAAAVERPVVAVFGPSNHRAWGPYPPNSPRHTIVREPLACTPCIHRGHRFGTPEGCRARTCLELVSVDMVFAAARAVLDRNRCDDRPPTTDDGRLALDHGRRSLIGGGRLHASP